MERLNQAFFSYKKWMGILLVLVALGGLVWWLYTKKRKQSLNTEPCEIDYLSTDEECISCFSDEKTIGQKDQA